MAKKAPDAFRTITEVSEWLETPTYVLRFWESRFPQIKPVKRAGGRRYYRPEDMRLLGGIKRLLHFEGQSIKAVKDLIREKGVRHVMELSPDLDKPVRPPQSTEGARELPQDVEALVAAAEAEPPAPPKVSARVIRKGKVAGKDAQAGTGDDESPAVEETALEDTGEAVAPEPLSVRVIKHGKSGPPAEEAERQAEAAPEAAVGADASEDASDEVSQDVTSTPESKAAESESQTEAAAAAKDEPLEEWEREDPMIVEPVPYRVRARHHYTETQLASIRVLVAELTAVRDRIAARIES